MPPDSSEVSSAVVKFLPVAASTFSMMDVTQKVELEEYWIQSKFLAPG